MMVKYILDEASNNWFENKHFDKAEAEAKNGNMLVHSANTH